MGFVNWSFSKDVYRLLRCDNIDLGMYFFEELIEVYVNLINI